MQNWQVKEIPVPLSNTTRYNLVDGETGEVITELSDFTKEQRDLIESAPLLLEALKESLDAMQKNIAYANFKDEWTLANAIPKALAAIAKTEGKSHEQ